MKLKSMTFLSVLFWVIVAIALVGCSFSPPSQPPTLAVSSYIRPATQVKMPAYTGNLEMAVETDSHSIHIDLSNLSKGYVAAVCQSPVRAKLLVSNQNESYSYNMNTNGEAQYFPLAMGNGEYTFEAYLLVEDTTYERVLAHTEAVKLEDEFVPFLLPNTLIEYTENSSVVNLAHSLAENASSDLEVVQQIYHWVQKNISYDYEKAEYLKSVPFNASSNLEQVLLDKKGVCLDIASLVAAMLRANDIPCKMVIGYVDNGQPQPMLHAWNMVWLEESGQIEKRVSAQSDAWNRLDLTMAIDGAADYKVLTDDSNYNAQSEH